MLRQFPKVFGVTPNNDAASPGEKRFDVISTADHPLQCI